MRFRIFPERIAMVGRKSGPKSTEGTAGKVLEVARGIAPVITGEYRDGLDIVTESDGTTYVGGRAAHSSHVEAIHETLRTALETVVSER